MAGDWIKIEKATPAKPEVLAISESLQIHPAHAFGLCVKFWMWCDDHLTDGNAKNVTKVTLDFVIGHDGMTDALIKVGWLRDRSGSLEVPHFDRHLSEGAKTRALTKERVRKSKAKNKGETANETGVKKVTQGALLEKRREENNNNSVLGALHNSVHSMGNNHPPGAQPRPNQGKTPTLQQVKDYAPQAGADPDVAEIWWLEMDGQGWVLRDGRPITNWQSVMASYCKKWESNRAAKSNGARPKNGSKPRDYSW